MKQDPSTDEVLKAVEATLKRYEGRAAAPASALPYSVEQIQLALLEELRTKGVLGLSLERLEVIQRALIELQAFVPDKDVNVVRVYQSHGSDSQYLADAERRRAQAILARIQLAQVRVTEMMRKYVPAPKLEAVSHGKPVVLGGIQGTIDTVSRHKQIRTYAFLSIFLYTIVLGVVATGWGLPLDKWESWAYLITWLLSGALGYVPLWIHSLMNKVARDGTLLGIVGVLFIISVFGLPLAVAILAYKSLTVRFAIAGGGVAYLLVSILVALGSMLIERLRDLVSSLRTRTR